MVHGKDRTALSGYVLTTHDVPLEPQGPEERLGGPDDGAVDGFSHALTLSAPRPTATGIHWDAHAGVVQWQNISFPS